jgi:hypothetical protein
LFKFTFNNTPLKNSYIEFRVEQQYQYNPRMHASMMDDFTFFEAQHFTESICATSYASRGFNAYTPCNTIIPSNIDMFPRQEMPEWTNDVLPIITSIRPMIDEIFEEVPYDTELYEFSRIAYGLINIPLFEPLRKKFRTRQTLSAPERRPEPADCKARIENFPQFIRKHVGRNR